MARPSKYGEEFEKDAVRLVRQSHRTCADVARELGMNRETLRVWVREAENAEADTTTGLARSEREELMRLCKQAAEAFNATLKRELLHGRARRRWSDERQARTEVFHWIAWYNHRRRHSAIGNLSPAAYEDRLVRMAELAA